MKMEDQILAFLAGKNPTQASMLADAIGVKVDSCRAKLCHMHKAGTLRAEARWLPHSRKAIMFYFISLASQQSLPVSGCSSASAP
jgi:hypothetical protein